MRATAIRLITNDPREFEKIHKQYLSRFPNVARIHSNFALRTVCKKNGAEFINGIAGEPVAPILRPVLSLALNSVAGDQVVVT
jgi:hypothetical protein